MICFVIFDVNIIVLNSFIFKRIYVSMEILVLTPRESIGALGEVPTALCEVRSKPKLENLKVLKRLPDLHLDLIMLKSVKVNLGLLFKHILFYYIWAWWPFCSNDLFEQLLFPHPKESPYEKKLLRPRSLSH